MDNSALRLFLAVILAILCIASGINGTPGSILGSLIDAQHMTTGSSADF